MSTNFSTRHTQRAIVYNQSDITYNSGFMYDVGNGTPFSTKNSVLTAFSTSRSVTTSFSGRNVPTTAFSTSGTILVPQYLADYLGNRILDTYGNLIIIDYTQGSTPFSTRNIP